jgi:hypothetical protein
VNLYPTGPKFCIQEHFHVSIDSSNSRQSMIISLKRSFDNLDFSSVLLQALQEANLVWQQFVS